MNTKKQKTAKRSLAVIAVLLVCAMAIGGTIAWLTSTSTLDNKFTVGLIKPIDPNKPGPGPDNKPIPEEDKNPANGKLNGNLYEPHWVKDSKLVPGVEIAKDPYVGVGAGSEKSYVYIYVKNSMKNNDHIYFTINEGWEPVAGHVQTVSGQTTQYTGGLFKYTLGLDGSQQTNNTWTTKALFDKVVVSADANAADFIDESIVTPALNGTDKIGSIKVQSFVHQYYDATGTTELSEETVVLPAALKAFGIN